jgi:hypothetical protein
LINVFHSGHQEVYQYLTDLNIDGLYNNQNSIKPPKLYTTIRKFLQIAKFKDLSVGNVAPVQKPRAIAMMVKKLMNIIRKYP